MTDSDDGRSRGVSGSRFRGLWECGAAVFAASKVLGPLWSKVSILRYRITGPVDKPQINEVLRQPRKDAQQ